LIEEISRVYGYERIPETRMADELPPQRNNPGLENEERLRDLLVEMGLQEVVNYRLTSPDREARRLPPGVSPDDKPYVRLANPIASDRFVLRHSLLSSLLEVTERNAHLRERMGLFEIGPIFLASEEGDLPDELQRLSLILTGPRTQAGWQAADSSSMDFYDLKGILEGLFAGLRIENVSYEPSKYPIFHPGKCARVKIGERECGVLGELHPQVREHYDLPPTPLLAADLDLGVLMAAIPADYYVQPMPAFPPTLEDLAVVVDEGLPADQVEAMIRQAGGNMVKAVRLFDIYTGEQVGSGKKSLAYSLTYQADDRTLTDKDAAQIRQRIIRRLEQELGARIRS
jgi:phenylalanyl-tRNA synthetase beta chain